MDALGVRTPLRLSAVAEWLIAGAFLCATLAVGAMILQELRSEPAVSAAAAAPVLQLVSTPPAVPARAVSVPVLPLADGSELKIGQSVSAVAARLGRAAESGRQDVDRGRVGERLTRFYEYQGTRFILVFEPLERDGESRLVGIYLR